MFGTWLLHGNDLSLVHTHWTVGDTNVTGEWESYRNAALQAFAEKNFALAENIWRQAREMAQSFDKFDPRVTESLEGLAEALWHQGKLEEAEQLCNYVLHLFKVTRGPSHPDYGVVSNNLAMLYHFQGKFTQAETCYQRALEVLGKALGPGYPHVIAIANNYSDLLRATGRESEAEKVKRANLLASDLAKSGTFKSFEDDRSQPQSRAQPGSGQPGLRFDDANREAQSASQSAPTLQVPPAFAGAYEETWEQARLQGEAAALAGDWPNAERSWHAAVKAAESFPARDPRLCKSLESLAEVYWKQGKYNLAEPLSRRVLGIYESILGTNHPDVGFVANNLGMLYHAQGNLKSAAALYDRALLLLVSKLGPQHPSIFNLETNLKNVLIALGRTADAEAVKVKLQAAQQERWSRSGTYEAYTVENERLAKA
jgi:Flp pilus assembly protein TadD